MFENAVRRLKVQNYLLEIRGHIYHLVKKCFAGKTSNSKTSLKMQKFYLKYFMKLQYVVRQTNHANFYLNILTMCVQKRANCANYQHGRVWPIITLLAALKLLVT